MSPHNVSFYLIVVLIIASIIVGLIPLLSLLTLFISLSKRALTGGLKAEDLSSTFVRFLVSKHVYDLRLIFFAAIVAFLVSLLALLFHAETRTHDSTFDQAVTYLGPRMLTYLGPIAAVCATAAAWAYQTASKRLGVVDIFACEISTLCRVGTLFGSGSRFVEWYTHPPEVGAQNVNKVSVKSFVSEESYFPVFDNNAAELEVLEASVVKYITEFYTYMKATRDSLRRLSTIAVPQKSPHSISSLPDLDLWRGALANVIYALFLAYESGRNAIKNLIEYQPTAAENTIVILLTELTCYAFLIEHYAKEERDVRQLRLHLRERFYIEQVPALVKSVNDHRADETDWLPAKVLTDELTRRYAKVLNLIEERTSGA